MTKEENIKLLILDYLNKIEDENSILKGNLLKEVEKNFIINNPNAFIIGLISDQSVKAEIVWSLPYKLYKRITTFDIDEIVHKYDIEKLETIIREKPALHRYPNRMATYIYNTFLKIKNEYNGNASNIWNDSTAKEIVDNLEEFKGISHKKASLGTLLLVRDLDTNIKDKENIDIAYDI